MENKSNTEKEAIESPLFSVWRSIFLRLFNSDNTSELATVFGVFFKNKRDTVDVAGKEKIFNFTLNFTCQVLLSLDIYGKGHFKDFKSFKKAKYVKVPRL